MVYGLGLGKFRPEKRLRSVRGDGDSPRNFLNLSRKTVPSTLGSQNVSFFRSFTQRLTQHEDGLGKVRLFHETVGPDSAHQLVFADRLTIVLNQQKQNFKGFWRQGNRLLPPAHDPVFYVQPKIAKSVQVTDQTRHIPI